MKILSSTTLISLGLACLTLSLILMAHSMGISPDEQQELTRSRIQTAELVGAQCAPAAAKNDTQTMIAIIRQVAVRNEDLLSAGLRRADGQLIFAFGPHPKAWNPKAGQSSPVGMALSVPIARGNSDWGSVEFCYKSHASAPLPFMPSILTELISNPTMRLGMFVATAGFFCYYIYLRRTLRHLDPSSVIPPRVRAMLDALTEGVVVLDRRGQIVMANESFSRVTGIPIKQLPGRNAAQLAWTKPHTNEPTAGVPWSDVLGDGRSIIGASLGLGVQSAAEGQAASDPASLKQRIFMVNAAPVLASDGGVRGALATFDDVTDMEETNMLLKESRDEVQRQNVQLLKLATTDPLTGCLNRRSFLDQFEESWENLATQGQSLGCVMADVDKFKSINDRFGHAVGDDVLKSVSRILQNVATDNQGLVCRYGGEEFCLLFPNRTTATTGEIAEKLRVAIESELWPVTPVTASFGFSSSEQAASSVKELLDRADRALYTSKHSGRNRVTQWGTVGSQTVETATSSEIHPAIAAVTPPVLQDTRGQPGFLALTSALAYRHADTALHSKRVADLCMLAAPGLLSPDEAAQLEVAAVLHDVGKIGIPDSILLKPGPLTPDEWELMRHHDQFSVDVVLAAGIPADIVCIIAAHHIPSSEADNAAKLAAPGPLLTAARLLCIADSFDAMTSGRPYRQRMTRPEAFAELRRCSGGQFDAAVVEHFIDALERTAVGGQLSPREAA